MRPPKYPLEPLVRLRESQVDQATRDLAGAVGERGAAEARLRAAQVSQIEAERAAESLREGERAALERGELSAADLARTDAWEARAREESESLEGKTRRAEGVAADARGAEDAARAEVARRRADAEVIGKDHARWRTTEEREAEAREQEDAAEAWRPRPR